MLVLLTYTHALGLRVFFLLGMHFVYICVGLALIDYRFVEVFLYRIHMTNASNRKIISIFLFQRLILD